MESTQAGDGQRVIIVEPSRFFSSMLESVCRDRGLDSVCVGTISAALDEVSLSTPTAVLTALELPDDSGISLVNTLKGDPFLWDIPVAVVTGRAEAPHQFGARQPDRLIKKDNQVLARVSRFLEAILKDA